MTDKERTIFDHAGNTIKTEDRAVNQIRTSSGVFCEENETILSNYEYSYRAWRWLASSAVYPWPRVFTSF